MPLKAFQGPYGVNIFTRLPWRKSLKSLLFGESSFSHRFHSWPEHLFRERDRFNKDAAHYSRHLHNDIYSRHCHNDIGQGIESWKRNSCARSSRRLNLRKSRRFSLGWPLSWMKWNFLSTASGEQRSGFALKNSEAGYCSAVNYPSPAMDCANEDHNNEFELSCCPVEEASDDDHHNDEEESSGNRGHRHAGEYNCPEKDQNDGEEEVNKDESLRGGFDVKEAFRNGEDCEDEEERYDNWEYSWTSLLAVEGNCSEQCDEICEDYKKDSERTGLQGGEAYCFDPRGREDEKDEEYGKDAAEQGNEEGSLCRSSDVIEVDSEQCGDDDVEENDEDNKEGEGLLGTQDDCKQDGKGCGEEDDDEQGAFVYGGLNPRFNGQYSRRRKRQLLRNFPPPLPSLARTCNLPCHMPWVLLRSQTSDGRLVIQEFKVQHHEFFRAVRSNGRLILHLVRHDEEKARAHQAEMFSAEAHKTGDQGIHIQPNKDEECAVVEEVHEEEVMQVGKDISREEIAGKNVITEKNLARSTESLTIEVSNAWSPSVLNRGETVPSDSGQTQIPCFSHPTIPHLQGTSSPVGIGMGSHHLQGSSSPHLQGTPSPIGMGSPHLQGTPSPIGMGSPHLQGLSSPIGMGSKGVESPVGSRCPPKPNPLFGRPLSTIRPILG